MAALTLSLRQKRGKQALSMAAVNLSHALTLSL